MEANSKKVPLPLATDFHMFRPETWLVHEPPPTQPRGTPMNEATPSHTPDETPPPDEPANAMIYEELCQMHDWMEQMDRRSYETWYLTHRMNAWNLESGDYEEQPISM